MGGAHAHRHDHDLAELSVRGLPRTLLVGGLVLAGLAALLGLVLMWPGGTEKLDYYGAGVTEHEATVQKVTEPCPVLSDAQPEPAKPMPPHCNELTVTVLDGPDANTTQLLQIQPNVAKAGLQAGDGVSVLRTSGAAKGGYAFKGIDRDLPLGLMLAVFVLAVAAVARLKGLLAMAGLVVAGAVVLKFMLPALLAGSSGVGVALVGSALIMYVVLYLAHGFSLRTSTALAGTLVGIAVTTLLGVWAVSAARLSGLGGESAGQLLLLAGDVNFKGLLSCAVIIAGLGVLNDVTITQASSVWELRAASPDMSRVGLFAAGMRIGRDHIASTIYTIVFAYSGTALGLLMLISLYDRPLLDLVSDDAIAEEVVRTLASAIGLVLAVPITTGLGVLMLRPGVGESATRSDDSVAEATTTSDVSDS